MTTIITRAGKGSPLTNNEMDTNLTNINTDKLEKSNNLSELTDATTALINLGERTGATGSLKSPAGTTAQRDGSPQFGWQRANSTLSQMEWYNGSAWVPMGGEVTLSDTQTLTNKTLTSPVIDNLINYSGSSGKIQVGGVDAVVITPSGITSGVTQAAALPAQAGNGGRVLTTDGTIASWQQPLVTSVNGQSGAVVSTYLYAIGSFVIGRSADASNYGVGSVIAGSSLYATSVSSSAYSSSIGFAGNSGAALVNIGSWRCVSPCYGNGTSGYSGLWVRYV